MKKASKRILCITIKVILSILILLSLCFWLLYLIFDHQAHGYVSVINSTARTHYNMFTNGTIVLDALQIPTLGEYCVYGENYNFSGYTAYANDFIENDTLFYGSDEDDVNGYWAVRFIDGEVSAVWSANYPLEPHQLCRYTETEQLKQISLFGKFNQSDAIGYYEVTENTGKSIQN